jgi:hypothetical protein
MLIVFVTLIVPVTFALGVVAVDASMWQSERRGAQKDADLAALAGALPLIPDLQDAAAARQDAVDFANSNDEAGNAPDLSTAAGQDYTQGNTVVVDNSCFGTDRLDAVRINLDHNSRTFFSSIFGVEISPDIGAHARACVGSLTNPKGLRPFAIDLATSPCFVHATDVPPPAPADVGEPNFGAECTLDFGSKDQINGERGVLDLESPTSQCSNVPGSGDLVDTIADGANGTCFTNQTNSCPTPYDNCVVGQTGNVANKTLTGIQDILAREGDCDARYTVPGDNPGIDDFEEAVELFGGDGSPVPPGPDNLFMPRLCNDAGEISPRLITIVAVPNLIGQNNPMPIRYFVPMYIVGCVAPNLSIDRMCTGEGPNGHIQLRGIIFQAYFVNAGDVGAPDDSGSRGITLDE